MKTKRLDNSDLFVTTVGLGASATGGSGWEQSVATVHRALAKYAAQPPEDSLVLQDHQQPVRYRNIWIRRVGTYDK